MSSTPACSKNACSRRASPSPGAAAALTRHDRIDLAAIAHDAIRTHDRSGLESVVVLEPAVICGDPSSSSGSSRTSSRTRSGTTSPAAGSRSRLARERDEPSSSSPTAARSSRPGASAGSSNRFSDSTLGAAANDGIGLGLPIVQAIAGAHNASLTAEALSGGGLKVDVCFPAVPASLGRTGGRRSLEREADRRASRWLVVDGDGGVLVFEEALCDRQAEPGSAVGAAGGRGSADAGLEDVREEVGVDSGAVVSDGDLDGRLVRGGPARRGSAAPGGL